MAHQDVVPVFDGSTSRWTYPPFSGHFDGRFLWGRGSSDCKNNLIGILESWETLLEKGITPQRTVIAAFGFDEEIGGYQGASYISRHLEEVWGREGVELIIDEGGGGIKEVYGAELALPALGEKGETTGLSPQIIGLFLLKPFKGILMYESPLKRRAVIHHYHLLIPELVSLLR
jgi:Gly-Xaa carboxypeptidase